MKRVLLYLVFLIPVVAVLSTEQVGGYLWKTVILGSWGQMRLIYAHATRLQVGLGLVVLLAALVSLYRYTIMSVIWYRQARARKRMYSDHDWTA